VKLRLVGFNINNFDLPSLAFALYRHELELPNSVKQGKWDAIDLYKHPFWGNGGLKEYSRRLGNPRTDSGADVAGLVEAREWLKLKKYCAEDVVDTVKLFRCAATVFKF